MYIPFLSLEGSKEKDAWNVFGLGAYLYGRPARLYSAFED